MGQKLLTCLAALVFALGIFNNTYSLSLKTQVSLALPSSGVIATKDDQPDAKIQACDKEETRLLPQKKIQASDLKICGYLPASLSIVLDNSSAKHRKAAYMSLSALFKTGKIYARKLVPRNPFMTSHEWKGGAAYGSQHATDICIIAGVGGHGDHRLADHEA